MFLYNILTGGSSKQELPKLDKISFKIGLYDNIPQYHEVTSQNSTKPYQYQDEQELTPQNPLFTKIFKEKTNFTRRKSSFSKKSFESQGKDKEDNLRLSNKENATESIFKNKNDKENLVDEKLISQHEQENIEEADIFSSEESQQEKQERDERYHYYKTTQNDTLFGIALKLDIHEQQIQQINGLGQSLYPGMTIKLPKYCDIQKLYEKQQENGSKVKISELLGSDSGLNIETQKYDVQYYAGQAGYIKGTLSINRNYIIFNPDLQDQTNLKNYSIQKLLKFNAIVETFDIQNVQVIDIPQMQDTESKIENPDHNFIIQIFLYTVGNPKIQKKYQDRLSKLKFLHKPIASISFTLRNYQSDASKISTKIQQQIQLILDQLSHEQQKNLTKSQEQKHLTNIPFFDIIHENLHPKLKQQFESIVQTPQKSAETTVETVSPSLVCGILTETSDVISDTQFHNLSLSLPLLYQQCNWTRIYSSTINGTSFITFLNKSQGFYPLILLVKEYKGWKFGAYICQGIQTGKTGRGEMFLFTYKNDSEVPDIFKWTTKNEFFVYIQKDSGIGIGMGVKYGLFLKNTLDKGSSSQSYTFGNTESLSKKEDFIIEQVELWTVDNSY